MLKEFTELNENEIDKLSEFEIRQKCNSTYVKYWKNDITRPYSKY